MPKTKYGSRYKNRINYKSNYKSKYKTNYKYTKKNLINNSTHNSKNNSTNKQKSLRIIFQNSPGLVNDATIYKNEFIKQGYKVDFKVIEFINQGYKLDFKHKENKENKEYKEYKEPYYDVNLFLETLPFKCKNIFPSKTNLFMPNNELFIDTKVDNEKYGKRDKYGKLYTYNRYEELKSIDYVLCKTEICHKFFNFIKSYIIC